MTTRFHKHSTKILQSIPSVDWDRVPAPTAVCHIWTQMLHIWHALSQRGRTLMLLSSAKRFERVGLLSLKLHQLTLFSMSSGVWQLIFILFFYYLSLHFHCSTICTFPTQSGNNYIILWLTIQQLQKEKHCFFAFVRTEIVSWRWKQ